MIVRVRGVPPRPLGIGQGGPLVGLAVYSGGVAQAVLALDTDDDVDLGSTVDPDGTLRATLVLEDTSIDFELEGADDSDRLDVTYKAADHFRVNLVHAQKLKPCRARCYDGRVGDPCVDCTRDGITVRICC